MRPGEHKQLIVHKKFGKFNSFRRGAKSEIFRFIQCICYDGKETDRLMQLRVSLYRKMKTKSSQNMSADKQHE